jgi:hypothetical protein
MSDTANQITMQCIDATNTDSLTKGDKYRGHISGKYFMIKQPEGGPILKFALRRFQKV